MRLADKVAVVTGGGAGGAISLRFAAGGAKVVDGGYLAYERWD